LPWGVLQIWALVRVKGVKTREAPKESFILHKAFWKKRHSPTLQGWEWNYRVTLCEPMPTLQDQTMDISCTPWDQSEGIWTTKLQQKFLNYVLIYKFNFPNWWLIDNNILILVNWNCWKILKFTQSLMSCFKSWFPKF
jgi:hypothetical protein